MCFAFGQTHFLTNFRTSENETIVIFDPITDNGTYQDELQIGGENNQLS